MSQIVPLWKVMITSEKQRQDQKESMTWINLVKTVDLGHRNDQAMSLGILGYEFSNE